MRRLFEFPEVLGEAGDRRRRIEHDLGAVEAEQTRAFREMPVVTDVRADTRELRLERLITGVPWLEVVLLPKPTAGRARRHLRDVVLAIDAEHGTVGIDDHGGVIVHAADRTFVERHDEGDPELAREILHQARRRTVGDEFGRLIPFRILLGTEVRPIEELLQTHDLRAAFSGLTDHAHVLLDRDALVHFDGLAAGRIVMGLDQTDGDDVAHSDVVPSLIIARGGMGRIFDGCLCRFPRRTCRLWRGRGRAR